LDRSTTEKKKRIINEQTAYKKYVQCTKSTELGQSGKTLI